MKYKMVVSDFDGTLLRSDNTVSDYTLRVIKEYVAKGGVFTISTGRMHNSIIKYLPELGMDKLDIPIMTYHGSLVVNNLTKERLFSVGIDYLTAYDVVKEFEDLGIYCHIYDLDKMYVEKATQLNELYCSKTRSEMTKVGKLSEYILRNKMEVTKILSISDPKENDEGKCGYFMNKFASRNVQFFATTPWFFEAASGDAGKGVGITKAAEYLNICLSDVIAVGDSINDISMIEAAGLGVAMGNALDKVKASAKLIADTNDNDGVAKLIEKYCL